MPARSSRSPATPSRAASGQFQIQAFPFRMTPENIARHRDDPNMDFWLNAQGRLRPLRGDPPGRRRSTSATRTTSSTPTPAARRFNAVRRLPGLCRAGVDRDRGRRQAGLRQREDREPLAASSSATPTSSPPSSRRSPTSSRPSRPAAAEDAARKPLLRPRLRQGRQERRARAAPPIPDTATAAAEPEPAAAPKAQPAPQPPRRCRRPARPRRPPPSTTTTTATAVPQPAPAPETQQRLRHGPRTRSPTGGSKFLPSGLDVPPPTAN